MKQNNAVTAYIGLGSNQGDSAAILREALVRINQLPEVQVVQAASLYRSAPWGKLDQEWFYNTVACIKTTLNPHDLLTQLLAVEQQLGRVRAVHWGPRSIDLDLLLYDQLELNSPDLTVPHPHMLERAFVMIPLAEIAPTLNFRGKTSAYIAKILKNNQEIVGTDQKVW